MPAFRTRNELPEIDERRVGTGSSITPEYALNSEVKDLQTRIDTESASRCSMPAGHGTTTPPRVGGEITDLIPYVRVFPGGKILAWLEVLSVLGM